MSGVKSYKDLIVWQKSINLVEVVYKMTMTWPKHETYGLTSQLRRSTVSIPSNIAEGQARGHRREFKRFLHIALGSLAEAHTQLIIANRLNYVDVADFEPTEALMLEVQRMLRGLMRKLPD